MAATQAPTQLDGGLTTMVQCTLLATHWCLVSAYNASCRVSQLLTLWALRYGTLEASNVYGNLCLDVM